MKRVFFFLLSLFMTFSIMAITLEEAKSIALENNPDYLAKKEAVEAAKWDQVSSFLQLFPSGSLSASQSQSTPASRIFLGSDEENSQRYGFQFQQPIFMGGKMWLSYRMKSYSKQISELALQEAKLEITAKVEEKYFSALESQELLEIMKQQLQSVETNLESANIKYDMEMLSRTDLLQFQADLAAKETELILRQARYHTAVQDLKNTLNHAGTIELQPIAYEEDSLAKISAIPSEQFEPLLTKFVNLGKKNNYTLQSLKNTKKIASASELMAAGNSLPTIQLSVGKSWAKSWDETMNSDDVGFNDSQEISLTASIPIFPLVDNYADYASAKHQKRKTYKELETTENAIELAIESAALNVISFAKSIEQATLSLDYATEFYAQMEERFANGMITGTELLDAEVVLKNAKFSYTSAIYSYEKAVSQLMKLLSLEDKNELYKLFN